MRFHTVSGLAIAAFAAIAVAGCQSATPSPSRTASSSSPASPTASQPTPPASTAPAMLTVGQTATYPDGITVTVESIRVETLGPPTNEPVTGPVVQVRVDNGSTSAYDPGMWLDVRLTAGEPTSSYDQVSVGDATGLSGPVAPGGSLTGRYLFSGTPGSGVTPPATNVTVSVRAVMGGPVAFWRLEGS